MNFSNNDIAKSIECLDGPKHKIENLRKYLLGLQENNDFEKSFNEINKSVGSFMDYYYDNQDVFYEEYNRDSYKIYHTESALYCICPGKERELIWKGTIDIVDPLKLEQSVSDYVKVLTKKLKEQKILILE